MKTGRRVRVRVGGVTAEAGVLQGKCHEQRASGNWKEQGIHSPKSPEAVQPWEHFDFSPLSLCQTSDLRNCHTANLCYFEPLTWQLVTPGN